MAFLPDQPSKFVPDAPPDPIHAANAAANATEHGPMQDVLDMLKGVPSGLIPALKGMVSQLTDPYGSAMRAGAGLVHAAQNPQATLTSISSATPAQVGANVVAPIVAGGAISKGAGLAGGAADAAAAAPAAEAPFGMQTGEGSPIARNVAGPSAMPAVAAHNQGIADQRLGAQVGATPGPLGGTLPDGRPVLEGAKDVPNAVYKRVAKNLPTAPLSPAAEKIAQSVGTNDLNVHSPDTQAMIEAQKQRLLSGPLTGDQAVDAERALRYNGFKNQGLQDPENQALGSAQLKLSDAVHQHMQDTLPLNADVSMDQLAQARQSLAQIHTLQGALKGNNVNLQGLAKVHRDNPGLLTGDMAQIADFADKHPEVTGLPSNEERFNPSGVVKDVASIDLKSPQSYLQPFFGALARRSLTGAKVAPTTSGLGNDLAPIDRTPQAPPGMTAGPMGVPPAAAGQPGQIPLAELLAHGVEQGPSPGLSAGPMGAPAPQGMPFTPNLNHAAGGLEVAPPQHTYGGQPANNSELGHVLSQGVPEGDMTRTGTRSIVHWDGDTAKPVSPDVNQIDQMTPPKGSIAIDTATDKLVSSGSTPRSLVEGLMARWRLNKP